jgi:hypothetical protein
MAPEVMVALGAGPVLIDAKSLEVDAVRTSAA